MFNYYNRRDCRYAEVEVLGKVVTEGDKSFTDKLRIVRELSWPEVLNTMYTQEGRDFKDELFPADETIRARETDTLGKILPSGTKFPVQFANGERNVLVVCRDRDHTYLVTEYIKFGQSYGEARLSRQASARSSEKIMTEVTSVNLSDHKNSWS